MKYLSSLLIICIVAMTCGCEKAKQDASSSAIIADTSELAKKDLTSETDKLQFEEIKKIAKIAPIRNIPDEYFYFFGKTIDEILEKFGKDYTEQKIENDTTSGKESSWYIRTTIFEYTDSSVTIYKTTKGTDWIERIFTKREGFQYIGDIKIGAPYQPIIDQLGNPNQLSAYGKPELIYSANNYILEFEISNGVVKSITIAVQL